MSLYIYISRYQSTFDVYYAKNDDIRVAQFEDEVVTLMASAGMTFQLTERNHGEVARALALQASPLTTCKWMWDAFWEGTEETRLQTLLRAHPGKKQHANITHA